MQAIPCLLLVLFYGGFIIWPSIRRIASIEILMPHLSRSLGVMQRIRSTELTMATSLAALDRLPSGVVLVDVHGEVTFANRAARRMLESGDGLRLKKLTHRRVWANLSLT